MATAVKTEIRNVGGVDVEVDVDKGKATPKGVKAFFGPNGDGRAVTAPELMALKRGPDGAELPDYDQIATGLANGTLTY